MHTTKILGGSSSCFSMDAAVELIFIFSVFHLFMLLCTNITFFPIFNADLHSSTILKQAKSRYFFEASEF